MMKFIVNNYFFSIISAILIASCSGNYETAEINFNDPVQLKSSNIGFLELETYSYYEEPVFANDIPFKVYSGYYIFESNKKLIKSVHDTYSAPKRIMLPQGEYIISAKSGEDGMDNFRINIEKGKILRISTNTNVITRNR